MHSRPTVHAQCSGRRSKPSRATAAISARPGSAEIARSSLTVLNLVAVVVIA